MLRLRFYLFCDIYLLALILCGLIMSFVDGTKIAKDQSSLVLLRRERKADDDTREALTVKNRPQICNNGSQFECICRAPDESVLSLPPYNTIKRCTQLLKSHEMPVIDIRMRHADLEAMLHTKERYEAYFKRRIATIVSNYCEHQVNECPGTALRMRQAVGPNASSPPPFDSSVLYADDDEPEPLLTQDNVVLLNIDRMERNTTRILFAVTKSPLVADAAGQLSVEDTMEPEKIKTILGSQAGLLSRILGGVRLESVRTAKLKSELIESDRDNTKLLIIVGCVATFFVVCYLIAIVKLILFCRKKRMRSKANSKIDLEEINTTTTYGAIEKGRRRTRNGSAINREEIVPLTSGCPELDAYEFRPELPEETSARKARRMFGCDSSQLPREPTLDSQLEDLAPAAAAVIRMLDSVDSTSADGVLNEQPLTFIHEEEPSYHRAEPEHEEIVWRRRPAEPESESKPEPHPIKKVFGSAATSAQTTIPTVTLVDPLNAWGNDADDNSRIVPEPSLENPSSPESPESQESQPHQQQPKATTIPEFVVESTASTLDEPSSGGEDEEEIYERPISRRGSRVDEPEPNLDVLLQSRDYHFTDLIEPDSLNNNHPLPDLIDIDPEKRNAFVPSPVSPPGSQWSSEEEVDVYYKLSDDEEHPTKELPQSNIPNSKVTLNLKPKRTTAKQMLEASASETEEEEDIKHGDQSQEDNSFVYTRLKEQSSPVPPQEE